MACGACCASYRVSFYWAETTIMQKYGLPELWTEKLNAHRVAMLGTNRKSPRCVALKGEVGIHVSCEIYDCRPSPCHEFQAGSERCLQAREKHGVNDFIGDRCA